MSSTRSPAARGSTWILCRSEIRLVANGEVICPVAAKAISMGSCPTCRWLEDADEDRRTSWTCSAEPVSGSSRQPGRLFGEADGELMIELL